MAISNTHTIRVVSSAKFGFYENLNAHWHKRALQVFMVIVLAHWGEHFFQAYQVYGLCWSRPNALGMLGLLYPWLVQSEILHYTYALFMLIGIWVLRKGFTGVSYTWWMVSFWIQFWHHFEHGLLLYQAQVHHNFFGSPVPTSILQIWFPRVEVHLFYNTVVFIPMVIGMFYHVFPPKGEMQHALCACSFRRED